MVRRDRLKKLPRLSVLLLSVLLCCFALLPRSARAADSGYNITAYNVDVSIGSDNVYHVTETITVNFTVPSHGIYRIIPYVQEMDWTQDNAASKVRYDTKINSVSVLGEKFSRYNKDGNLVLQIGDANKLVTGQKIYKISYDHALGDDKIKAQDFVYYNLIGTNWDCKISNVTFSVTLPKEFDSGKLWFFYGGEDSAEKAPLQYTLTGNTIEGVLKTSLAPGQGFTIQMDLPEGYFEIPVDKGQNIFIACALAILLLSLILFLLFGRDPVMVKTVEFYPPEGITPAEAGYIIDTVVDDKDVVSLIIYWASKGYLAIEPVGKEDFKLIKLKELEHSPNGYEKGMFYKIFDLRDTVMISELKERFYTQIAEVKMKIRKHYATKERHLYSRRTAWLGKMVSFLSGLLIFATIFQPLFASVDSIVTAVVLSFFCTMLIFIPVNMLESIVTKWYVTKKAKKTATLIAFLVVSIVIMLAYIGFMWWRGMLLTGASVAASTILTGILGIFMRKRTHFGNDILGKLVGFKNFLEFAEKDRIERLVEENPSYFYDVLPYAYVLGVSDKWAKKFEGIAMPPPSWYYGYNYSFTPFIFYSTIFNSMSHMQSAMIAQPVPVNTGGRGGFGGGGFGGGGFSGGGFGGGGGGRW